jgi:hypothetical protein
MRRLAASLIITFAGWAAVANGQDRRWQPVETPVANAPGSPAVTLGAPTVTLGPPVAAPSGPVVRGQKPDDGATYSQWVAGTVEPNGDGMAPVTPLQVPAGALTVSSSAPYTPAPPPAANAFGSTGFYPDPPPPPSQAAVANPPSNRVHKSYFGDMFNGLGGGGPEGKCLESDHCFDYFASPVSNPFYFEDPRSLTEVRPIFMYQTIPGSNPVYRGGNAEFYGVQARVAITDQWSFVMNKLGGVSINPGGGSPVPSESGFAEIWLGPKWTFLRNTETGTVVATGLTFEIPAGADKVGQDTGTLSLVPYLTAAQNFGCTSYGSFNAMATLGYSFRIDDQRSDYFYTSWHLDFDVGNQHHWYPLVELNWFHYTESGGAVPFNFEGGDLANFGSTNVSGRNELSLATGFRYKFTENIQTGLFVQFPLVGTQDINRFRLGVDLIFRY